MPTSETFDWTREDSAAGIDVATNPITIGANEIVRVRVSEYRGDGAVWITISRNSVVSRMTVDAAETWATSMVAEGDVVALNARLSRGSSVSGIIEALV